MRFVFDIDDTICQALEFEPQNTLDILDKNFGPEFVARNSIEIMGYTHAVFPGFYSLFRWLDEQGCSFHFFSGGTEERNRDFVNQFIRRSHPTKADVLLQNIKIFSRQHRTDTSYLGDNEREIQSICAGVTKKKLTGIIVSEDELPNTLLVDDDISYITGGEEANFVLVPAESGCYYNPNSQQNFFSFHKAYYLCGLFSKIFEISRATGKTLSQSAWHLQIELSGNDFNRSFRYPTRNSRSYFADGLAILQQYDPGLVFFFQPHGHDAI